MSLNLDQIKNRLSNLQKTTTKKSNYTWKPDAGGDNRIRIVPYQFNKDFPFIEAYFHYGFAGKTYLSPSTYGEPDPIVEFAEALKSTGNKDDWKEGRKLDPKMRVYAPVIVRGKESEGVKLWGFGKKVYEELLTYMADPDYGDITDLKSGRDIVVKYTAGDANNFPSTTLLIKPNALPATEDKDIAKKIINDQTDFYDVFEKVSYDDLKGALEKFAGEAGDEVESGTDTDTTANSLSTTSANSTDNAGDAFDKLFNSDEK